MCPRQRGKHKSVEEVDNDNSHTPASTFLHQTELLHQTGEGEGSFSAAVKSTMFWWHCTWKSCLNLDDRQTSGVHSYCQGWLRLEGLQFEPLPTDPLTEVKYRATALAQLIKKKIPVFQQKFNRNHILYNFDVSYRLLFLHRLGPDVPLRSALLHTGQKF